MIGKLLSTTKLFTTRCSFPPYPKSYIVRQLWSLVEPAAAVSGENFSSDKTLKSFIQSPLLHLSFLFENAKRTSCLTKTSLPQIMLNECWQAKSDAANILRSVFEWSLISQDISKYLIFVFDFLSKSLYICTVFMDLCWLIGGSLFQWNSQYLAPRGERNPSFPLWGPEVNFLSVICNNNNLYFVLLKISLISGK